MLTKEMITDGLMNLQDRICSGLETLDGIATFREDKWERPGGGGGRTRVLQKGAVIEKGGVNFSSVHGEMPALLLKTLQMEAIESEEALNFFATGVSIVLHPESPMTPIIHMNVRYFEISNGVWWFGGGIDLTPIYVDIALAKDFHQKMKVVCDRFHPSYYARFKSCCDDYFYIKHRKETRGVGGIFFDRLGLEEPLSKEQLFEFIIAVGNTFLSAYATQVETTRHLSYGEKELHWQSLRRARYVEYNLVWDRGTQFGLQTDGRTESILMSMPPVAAWEYDYQPAVGSAEAETLKWLQKGIDWIHS
jgi:coproporphyrinogen III oxidase